MRAYIFLASRTHLVGKLLILHYDSFYCITLFFFQIFISAFALIYGNPLRLVNGYDSFGNTCGTTNELLGELSYSGMDMTDRP